MVFVTGATGYLGSRLIPRLLERGHRVRALVRAGSERRVAAGCEAVTGDALRAAAFSRLVERGSTVVHLVGTPKPAPWKARQFREVDLPAAIAAIDAAHEAGAGHFVYVSVAHPAPVMKAYIAVRQECERYLEASGLPSTVLRPWYVLGPDHWWPYALLPVYWLAERIPATAAGARRLGLVRCDEMVAALVAAVESQPARRRVWQPQDIRQFRDPGKAD
jgi:uncharacterized protein YbjT (DUF2867 family)